MPEITPDALGAPGPGSTKPAAAVPIRASVAQRSGDLVGVADGPFAMVLSSSPRPESSSCAAATSVGELLRRRGYAVRHADQRLFPMVPAGLDDHNYPPTIQALIRDASHADVLVLAGPVHRSAVSGATRNLAELVRSGLKGKAVLPIVAAGSARAHLAGDAFRAELIVQFNATALPPVVVTPELNPDELHARLVKAVEGLVLASEVRL